MMKRLMERCLSHETALECVCTREKATKAELTELKAQKVIQEEKLKALEQLWGELEKQVEVLRKVLKDEEDSLRQAKVDAIQEFCDFDALLSELGTSFADGFDDCLCQVKASFPDLNLSHITIDPEGQTPAHPISSEGTDELFSDDSNPDLQSDWKAQKADKQSIEDGTRQPESVQMIEEETPLTAVVSFLFYLSCSSFSSDVKVLGTIFLSV